MDCRLTSTRSSLDMRPSHQVGVNVHTVSLYCNLGYYTFISTALFYRIVSYFACTNMRKIQRVGLVTLRQKTHHV